MLQCFYPDKYIVSTYQINFDRLYEQGYYRGIILTLIIRWWSMAHLRMSGASHFSGT